MAFYRVPVRVVNGVTEPDLPAGAEYCAQYAPDELSAVVVTREEITATRDRVVVESEDAPAHLVSSKIRGVDGSDRG